MVSIQDLPDEILLPMCESWDTPTLLNMAEAYSHVYQLCEKEIGKRKEQDLRIKKVEDMIKFRIFNKKLPNGNTVYIDVVDGVLTQSQYSNDRSKFNQPIEKVANFPFPEMDIFNKLNSGGRRMDQVEFDINNKILVKRLAIFLIDEGYTTLSF